MAERGAVHCADHRHVDRQKVREKVFSRPAKLRPFLGAHMVRLAVRFRIGGGTGKSLAGASHDHDLVLAIAADLKKSVLGFFVRKEAPAQRPLLGVKPHLENAVLAAKDNGLVFVLVVSE